jgi:hypothetical protein
MYSVTIDKRGGFVHAPRNKITAKKASHNLSIFIGYLLVTPEIKGKHKQTKDKRHNFKNSR